MGGKDIQVELDDGAPYAAFVSCGLLGIDIIDCLLEFPGAREFLQAKVDEAIAAHNEEMKTDAAILAKETEHEQD